MRSDTLAPAVLPLHVAERLCDALAACTGMHEALGHIDRARDDLLGRGLLTVNVDATQPGGAPGELQLRRAWSSDTEAYPVGGGKRKQMTPWTRQLLVRGEVFIGEGEAALQAAFDDAPRIAALGMQAVINVPILSAGRCVATFNVLGTRPQWKPQEIVAVRLLALLAQPFILRG